MPRELSPARRRELQALKARRDTVDRLYRAYLKAAIVSGRFSESGRKAYLAYKNLSDELARACTDLGVSYDPHDRRNDILKSLSPAVRKHLAPILYAGLTNASRERWIENAQDLTAQILQDRAEGKNPWTDGRLGTTERSNLSRVQAALARDGITAYDNGNPPIIEATRTKRAADGVRTFTGAQLAKKLGADPRELRALIRRAKRNGTLTFNDKTYTLEQCKAIARVYKAWAKEAS
jgi:hypothetical protein